MEVEVALQALLELEEAELEEMVEGMLLMEMQEQLVVEAEAEVLEKVVLIEMAAMVVVV